MSKSFRNPVHFDRHPLDSYAQLVDAFPDSELCSPTRSNVPLLSLLRDGEGTVAALLDTACLPSDSSLHVEFTVKPPAGRGKGSHSDLMVRSRSQALAIEAKWTEPRYETVAKWLLAGSNVANREKVLAGWLSLLQPHATRKLNPLEFGDCVYQLVHRAASACWQTAKPQLAYLIFQRMAARGGESAHYCRADLEHLHGLLGCPENFPFHHFQLELNPTNAFASIEGLPKRKQGTSEKIRTVLLGETLFDFGRLKHHRIGGTE